MLKRRGQLSVYLENRVGALAEVCALIERERINLVAICAIDTVEEAVLRIVPEQPERAAQRLSEHGFNVIATEILAVELENHPGAMGRVARILADRGINIDYLYASSHPAAERTLLVLRTHQLEDAENTLRETFGVR